MRLTGLFENRNGNLIGSISGKYLDPLRDLLDRTDAVVFAVCQNDRGYYLLAAPDKEKRGESGGRSWNRGRDDRVDYNDESGASDEEASSDDEDNQEDEPEDEERSDL